MALIQPKVKNNTSKLKNMYYIRIKSIPNQRHSSGDCEQPNSRQKGGSTLFQKQTSHRTHPIIIRPILQTELGMCTSHESAASLSKQTHITPSCWSIYGELILYMKRKSLKFSKSPCNSDSMPLPLYPDVTLFPSNRCGGCCNQEGVTCRNTTAEYVNKTVSY